MSLDDQKLRDSIVEKILRHEDLRGFDFSGRVLSGLKFYHKLENSKEMFVPDLSAANFSGAVLHNCDFLDGRLRYANFSHADLKGSYMFGADIRESNFDGAFLGNCHLYGSDLSYSSLNKLQARESLVSACELNNSVLIGADFSGSSLKDSHFIESNLANAIFSNAYMEGVYLQFSRLRNADFTKAVMFRADLGKVDARLAIFKGSILGKYDCEVGQYHGANMARADFTGADFTKAELVGVNLHSAIIINCNFRGANLRGANLTDSQINEKTNLNDTNLVRARIKGVDFSCLRLSGANLFETMIDFEEIPQNLWEEEKGDFIQAWEAYSQLKTNFKSLGDRKGEKWASRKERRLRGICNRLMKKNQKEKVPVG